jgi:hydrogenase maturation protein HypF
LPAGWPLPLEVPSVWKIDRNVVALAVKRSAVAVYNGHQAALGPHIGDVGSVKSRERFLEQLDGMKRLYEVDQALLVTDQHPATSTAAAEELQGEVISVQHHHAHLVGAMLELGWLDGEVLGVVWDGTGYGTDATVWGGEFLVGTVSDFRRVAHLRPSAFGGDAAIREPWRSHQPVNRYI